MAPEHSRSLWLPRGAVQWRGAAGSGRRGPCEAAPGGLQGQHARSFPIGVLSVVWAPPEQWLWGGACLHPGPAIPRLLAGPPSRLL